MEDVLGDVPRPRRQGGDQRRWPEPPRAWPPAPDDLAGRLGLSPRIAVVEGDDSSTARATCRRPAIPAPTLDTGQPLDAGRIEPVTANAYLGAWGIAAALAAGADVVVCPRVTDASLVGRTGRLVARVGPTRLGPPRGGGRRRPRHRVRSTGDRRQLLASSTSSPTTVTRGSRSRRSPPTVRP